MTQQAIPVLPALKTGETISFYETKLGFSARDHGEYASMENHCICLRGAISTPLTEMTSMQDYPHSIPSIQTQNRKPRHGGC
jgi:hypothetical protein